MEVVGVAPASNWLETYDLQVYFYLIYSNEAWSKKEKLLLYLEYILVLSARESPKLHFEYYTRDPESKSPGRMAIAIRLKLAQKKGLQKQF